MSNQPTRVLLIEDSQEDAALIRMRLLETNSDLEVSCADRLSTGLAALDEELPAVVLLDLNLPDSRGAETFRKILNKAPAVPVVVLSGIDDEELAVQAVHQGVQDYLVKDAMDSRQLLRTLRYAIARQTRLAVLEMSGQSPRLRRRHGLSVQPLAEMERLTIINTVNEVGILEAARLLGIGKTTIYRKLAFYRGAPWDEHRPSGMSK